MDDDWWPALLADFPRERPWADPDIVVAEVASSGEGAWPGERLISAALVSMDALPAVRAELAHVGHEVTGNGPRPDAGAAGTYTPGLWIYAKGARDARLEPLVLSWHAHSRMTLMPDPGFLMTYGLAWRRAADGGIAYDDPTVPVHNVVRVDTPAIWDLPRWTPSRVVVQRDYLQDYLSLRGMALVQGYYVRRFGPMDEECAALLADQDVVELKFSDRVVQVNRRQDPEEPGLLVQVWGGRVVAEAGDLPVSIDVVARDGLTWPGLEGSITPARLRELRDPFVSVRDDVLGAYEGQPDFSISPETGGVAFGTQWSVGFCRRVGRDTIRLELRKLYEGAPNSVIQQWHNYAVPVDGAMDRDAPANIATRAHAVTMGLLMLGDELAALALRLRVEALTASDLVGLNREELDYAGWWKPASVEPITRHAPLNMTVDTFLARCVGLDNLTTEGLGASALRRICRALGFGDPATKGLGRLKLLDLVARAATVASATAAILPDEAEEVVAAVLAQNPAARPLNRLFALNDLRNLGAHAGRDEARLWAALARFGFERDHTTGGYGVVLDGVYDAVSSELEGIAAGVARV